MPLALTCQHLEPKFTSLLTRTCRIGLVETPCPLSHAVDAKTSFVRLQGIFNALVYGSTDAVKSAVARELLVERCLKASGAGRGGDAGGSGGGTVFGGAWGNSGLDPEDEEEWEEEVVPGVGMVDVR